VLGFHVGHDRVWQNVIAIQSGFKVVSMHVISMYTRLSIVILPHAICFAYMENLCCLFLPVIYLFLYNLFFGKFTAGLFPNLSCGWCEVKVL
jgi:hypothetical protein